jgi:diguanylate cyclase (GGDEF)-like protein
MTPDDAVRLEACEREPIHLSGAIQPYGALLVVDPISDIIVQAAGDLARVLDFHGPAVGERAQAVLGVSLAELTERAENSLGGEPIYLATVGPFGGGAQMVLTAHRWGDVVIVEASPAGRSASAATSLAAIRSISESVWTACGLVEACEVAASAVRRISGYDRVMIYRFLPDGAGVVVAEVRDDGAPPFLHHRFPASDIPAQARELYRRSTIRVIPDVDYAPWPLEPALLPRTNLPLDMSQCGLRSVSPVHVQYLRNMGVDASMSVSLLVQGELWGLIACHNSNPRVVPYEALEICRHVGQTLSGRIQSHETSEASRVARERGAAEGAVLAALAGAEDPGGLLLGLSADLLQIAPSDGIAICMRGAVVTAGVAPEEAEVRRIMTWLAGRLCQSEAFVTDRLPEVWSEAQSLASVASGVLSVSVPADDPMSLMWFRSEQIEEVDWAGNPDEHSDQDPRFGALGPRRSFRSWRETVRGRSAPWDASDVQRARDFAGRVGYVMHQQRVRQLNDLLKDANERLAALASTDGLTGVANRRVFDERLTEELARARRAGSSLAMIMLDLDFFKQYNDHYGHPMGDDCLRQIAAILQIDRRPADCVARIGGEEFSILLPDAGYDGAVAVAEIIRDRIEGLGLPHLKSPNGVVTTSLGVAVASAGETTTGQDLMRCADEALYRAKANGRNQVVRGGPVAAREAS